jgi:DNA-binding transcriptional ArsR family regulator
MPATAPELFTALGDPTRRAIFERLSRAGELTVRALTEPSGVSQPAVSKHLGVQTHYSARPQALKPLADWMTLYGAFWRDRFDRLEDLLNRMDQ